MTTQSHFDVSFVPVYRDNYAYILRSGDTVGIVDPGEAQPVISALEQMGLEPDTIFVTHYHWDHADGVAELKARYPSAQVVAPDIEKQKIDVVDTPLKNNALYMFGNQRVRALSTPGHTLGSMCFYFEGKAVFTGDTLFSLSCGGLFEGTPEQMYSSFEKLKALPDETLVYCGHEYTRASSGFCLRVDPDNKDLHERIAQVKKLRARGEPTLPSTIGLEKKTNPFLRVNSIKEYMALRHRKMSY